MSVLEQIRHEARWDYERDGRIREQRCLRPEVAALALEEMKALMCHTGYGAVTLWVLG